MYDLQQMEYIVDAGQVSSLCAGCRGLWCDSAYSECHDSETGRRVGCENIQQGPEEYFSYCHRRKNNKAGKNSLNETQRIREVVADESSSMNGSLRIGILPTIAPYLVPDFIYHSEIHIPM